MTPQEAKAKMRRIVEANTTYTQIHQQADPTPKVNKKTLIDDLDDFIDRLIREK